MLFRSITYPASPFELFMNMPKNIAFLLTISNPSTKLIPIQNMSLNQIKSNERIMKY